MVQEAEGETDHSRVLVFNQDLITTTTKVARCRLAETTKDLLSSNRLKLSDIYAFDEGDSQSPLLMGGYWQPGNLIDVDISLEDSPGSSDLALFIKRHSSTLLSLKLSGIDGDNGRTDTDDVIAKVFDAINDPCTSPNGMRQCLLSRSIASCFRLLLSACGLSLLQEQ